jgi:hypothetical protein
MPHTEHFYVSTKNNSVKKRTEADREYFIPEGKKLGKAKYLIDVFGYNHLETAKKVRDMVDNGNMSNNLFSIRVETK